MIAMLCVSIWLMLLQVSKMDPSLRVSAIGHFQVLKTLTFKVRPSAQHFLWKWVLFAWDSISKAEHLTSFWYRGPGELSNGLLSLRSGGDRRGMLVSISEYNDKNFNFVSLKALNFIGHLYRWRHLMNSLRAADAFPFVASLPPNNSYFSEGEATTGNASAVRWLLDESFYALFSLLFHVCRTKYFHI